MDKKYAIGFIGMGNMASGILRGILEKGIYNTSQIIACDVDFNKLEWLYTNGIMTTSTADDVFTNADYVILAVKPQAFRQMGFYNKYLSNKAIISIMAGVTIEELISTIKIDRIARIMPNLPLTVGKGMSAICIHNLSLEDTNAIFSIFGSIGAVIEVGEDKFDVVTSISGSGPAYVYYFIQSMIESGVKNGLSYEEARLLTINTFYGATRLLELSPEVDISTLIDNVCSKGGTTIEAIETFRNYNVKEAIIEGVDNCFKRSQELSKR